MKTKKTRAAAVQQLESIRKQLQKKCYFTISGVIVSPSEAQKRYERVCAIFRRIYGELPTLREIAAICYPGNRFARS